VSATRPVLWGVLNVTPDSFSDGGLFVQHETALAHARELTQHGALIIDVGGESTRPGATRVDPDEEMERVIPVITGLSSSGITVSVDTMNASTAQAALDAGARYVNDVSGGLADPRMLSVVAASTADYVITHWRGHSTHMDALAHYDDVVADVCAELGSRIDAATKAGIAPERIIIDPGLGFAKNPEHNWALIHRIDALQELGARALVGASRKRFLGELLEPGHDVSTRDGVSAVLGVLLAQRGVWGLRVHNPGIHTQALDVWQAVNNGRPV
jgi:dihydropteroate synthase